MPEPADPTDNQNADAAAKATEQDLLLGLIYGVLHEPEPVGGAEFAVRIAVCARLTNGDPDLYAKAVKKAVVSETNLMDIFDRNETERVIRSFMRAARRARNDESSLTWLAGQFSEPQTVPVMKEYLCAVERALANSFIKR